MSRGQLVWPLTIRIVLACVAWVFTLGAVSLSLVVQPYVLVVVHNLAGAPVDLDLGVRGSAMGARHMGRGGWTLGVLKVESDTGIMIECRAGHAPPIRSEEDYLTSYLQQLLVMDIKRCDDIHIESHTLLAPLSWAVSKIDPTY